MNNYREMIVENAYQIYSNMDSMHLKRLITQSALPVAFDFSFRVLLDMQNKIEYNYLCPNGRGQESLMEFKSIDYPKKIILGQEYSVYLPVHIVLKNRRIELGLTQQQVADKAKILLRQYQRLESGERSITSASARIMLAVCAVLKVDPYIFFPEIKADSD